jgi:hypothetical protein
MFDAVGILIRFLKGMYEINDETNFTECAVSCSINSRENKGIQQCIYCKQQKCRNLYHELPYEKINSTLHYYGAGISEKFNNHRITRMRMENYPVYGYCPNENMNLLSCTKPTTIQLSSLEWIMIFCRKFSKKPKIHFGSIRSVMMDSTAGISTYVYPSILHFYTFPKDCNVYIVPLLIPDEIIHATLAIGTIHTEGTKRKGILELYDPMRDTDSHKNLQYLQSGKFD